MFSVKNVIIVLLTLTIFLSGIGEAGAVTIDFNWSGDNGYTARGNFSYDGKTAPKVITEKGSGKTDVLKSLKISFYDADGREVARYDNVVDGVSSAEYFRFNFNTETGEIFGTIDLGGESTGETYLKGKVNDNLSLFRINKGDTVIDEDSSPDILIESFR